MGVLQLSTTSWKYLLGRAFQSPAAGHQQSRCSPSLAEAFPSPHTEFLPSPHSCSHRRLPSVTSCAFDRLRESGRRASSPSPEAPAAPGHGICTTPASGLGTCTTPGSRCCCRSSGEPRSPRGAAWWPELEILGAEGESCDLPPLCPDFPMLHAPQDLQHVAWFPFPSWQERRPGYHWPLTT